MAKRRPSGDGMVRRRDDGRWEGRIVIGHKKNGDPIFHHDYANTQKELMEKLHMSIERYRDVELTEDSRMTLGEWLNTWLEDYKEGTIRPTTLACYRQFIEAYIKPELGHKQISLITSHDIQRMYNRLKKNGRINEHPEEGNALSDATVNHIHTMLHGAMKDAVQANIIPRNPTEGPTAPKPNYKPKKILNEQELETFLDLIRKDEVWYKFFYIELMTGLRRGEIIALQWDDLDFETGVLNVSKQVNIVKGELQFSTPKTKSSIRKIVLPPALVEVLREYTKTVVSRWMFPSPLKYDMPISPGVAERQLSRILELAGCKHMRFHDLRHTFATLALQGGMDIKTLSAMLGHVSAATTLDIYTHITDDMQRQAAANIDRGIGKATPSEDSYEPGRDTAPGQSEKPVITDFQPVPRTQRRPGTGCITQKSPNLWEGRYSPTWIDGKKHARNVYAHTREECEEKLKVLITEMKTELAELKRQKAEGTLSPQELEKGKKKGRKKAKKQ